jgi:hypothetical protein
MTSKSLAKKTLKANEYVDVDPVPVNGPAFLVVDEIVKITPF